MNHMSDHLQKLVSGSTERDLSCLRFSSTKFIIRSLILVFKVKCDIYFRTEGVTDSEGYPFTEVDAEEVKTAAERISVKKAPGVDGVPPKVMKAFLKEHPAKFCGYFRVTGR